MKNLLFISLLLFTLISCSKDEFSAGQYPHKWKLIKMTGQIANSETAGANMEWQETYLLNADGTFTKSRERNGISTEGSGKFNYKNFSDGKYLVLKYKTDNAIIGSCGASDEEVLSIRADQLIGTWSACDGPGLTYERIN